MRWSAWLFTSGHSFSLCIFSLSLLFLQLKIPLFWSNNGVCWRKKGWSAEHGSSLLLSISLSLFFIQSKLSLFQSNNGVCWRKKCDDQRDTAFHFAATLSFRLALAQRRANTYTTKGVCSKSYFDIENPYFFFRKDESSYRN